MDENPGGTPNPLNPNPVTPGVGVAGTGENMPTAENYTYAEPAGYAEPMAELAQAGAAEFAEPAYGAQPETYGQQPAMQAGAYAQPAMQQPTAPMHGQAMDFIQRPGTQAQMSPEMAQAQAQVAQMQAAQMQPNMPQMQQPTEAVAGFESFAMETQPTATDPMVAQMNTTANAGGQPVLEEDLAMAMSEVATGTPAPAEAQPVAAPVMKNKNKKKTGIIVAIVLFGVAVICGLAAVLIWLLNPGQDKVAAAVSKVLDGKAPTYVQVDGTIAITNSDEAAQWTGMNIKLNGVENNNTGANSASATITVGMTDERELSFDLDEVRVSDGDLYIKLSGVATALDGTLEANLDATNCTTDENGETNCAPLVAEDCPEGEDCMPEETALNVADMLLGVFEIVDEEWIRIPADHDAETEGMVILDNSSICLINVMSDLPQYYTNLGSLYNQNPFIGYSTDNLKISAKKNDLYRLTFDRSKLTAFENALTNSNFANQMLACVSGTATDEDLTLSQVQSIMTSNPVVYVEIDDNLNFTRLYIDGENADGTLEVTADLSLSYPSSMVVTEPAEYIDITEMLSRILQQFFSGDIIVEEEIAE